MKIYLFNPETGVYLGEDFADEVLLGWGEFVIPPDATTIAPPPFKCGEVPVFIVTENRWEVRPVAEVAGAGCDVRVQANLQSERHVSA